MAACVFLTCFPTVTLLSILALTVTAASGNVQNNDTALAPGVASDGIQGIRLHSSEDDWHHRREHHENHQCRDSFDKADIKETRRDLQTCGFPGNLSCPCRDAPYRQFNGACNNRRHAGLGAASSLYNRVLRARYADGVKQVVTRTSFGQIPKARVVSSTIFTDKDRKDKLSTLMLMQWSQLVAHDVSLRVDITGESSRRIDCCAERDNRSGRRSTRSAEFSDEEGKSESREVENPVCMPIRITRHDPFHRHFDTKCINFVRSQFNVCPSGRPGGHRGNGPAPNSTDDSPESQWDHEEANRIWHKGRHRPSPTSAQQLNMVTHFLDASFVYGNSRRVNMKLRLGTGGLLRSRDVSEKDEWIPEEDSFSSSTSSSSEDDDREFLPLSSHSVDGCDNDHNICYKAGDDRVNQHPWLASMQTLFMREHNRLARGLFSLHPEWDDETLFQEARRIVIAEWQLITYRDYLPKIVGKKILERMDMCIDANSTGNYSSRVNPSTLNEFAVGAFPSLLSLLDGTIKLLNLERSPIMKLTLSQHANDPTVLELDHNLEAVLRGLSHQPAQQFDRFVTKEMTTGSNDLVSDNIQRGRDHGLPSYNSMRDICGLRKAIDFNGLQNTMTEKNIKRLKKLYRSVHDVDLYVGGSLEEPCVDGDDEALVGPTFGCIIAEQFYRWRRGDRFFFDQMTGPGAFTEEQYRAIHDVTLASILCANVGGEKYMQLDPFMRLSMDNNLRQCEEFPMLNLTAWQGYQPPEACAPDPPPEGYINVPGVGFYKFYADKVMNFYDAGAICNNDGAHLAIINSEGEDIALMAIFANNTGMKWDYAYIGFHDIAEEGNYVTIFGQPLNETGFFRWSPNEPNNYLGNEDCGSIHRDGGLNDFFCAEYGPHNFICEYEPYWKPYPKP